MKKIKQLIVPFSLLLVLFFGYTCGNRLPPGVNYEYRWKCQRLNCKANGLIGYDNPSRPTTNIPDCTVQAGTCLLVKRSMKILGQSKTGNTFNWYCSRNGGHLCSNVPQELSCSNVDYCYNSNNGRGGWVMTDTNNAPLVMCDAVYKNGPEGLIYGTCDLKLVTR